MIKKFKENKFLLSLAILIVSLFLILIIRITYAFLKSNIMIGDETDVQIELEDLYSLQYIPGNNLDLTVNAETLPENGKDLEIVSTPHVELLDRRPEKSYHYNVYLLISGSDFAYTNGLEPEILLTINGPDGEVKEVSDLSYNTDLGGFDITQTKGVIAIATNKEMHSNGTTLTTQEWTFTLKYRNLAEDQSENLNKILNIKIIMQDEELTTKDILLAYANTPKQVTLYHHNAEDLTDPNMANKELIAGDDSYRYSGGNDIVNNYICFGGDCSNDPANPNYKNLYRIIGLFKNEDNESEDYGNYEMKLIKADGVTKEDLSENDAYNGNYGLLHDSYRSSYLGKNFDNLAIYYWNSSLGTTTDAQNVNMWKDSNLNTKNLNETYYNAIEEPYKKMIVEHGWQVGGTNEYWNGNDAHSKYEYELGEKKITIDSESCSIQGNRNDKRLCDQKGDIIYNAPVGLMYVSDYMYGTLPDYWTIKADQYKQDDVKNNDWLYIGLYEWTISRYCGQIVDNVGVLLQYINTDGRPDYDVGLADAFATVRPVVYLSSDAKIINGSGTESDPFILEVN